MAKKKTQKAKIKVSKKPISQKEWNFYENFFADFILNLDHSMNTNEDDNLENIDHYNKGVVKGTWAMMHLVETFMVEKK